MFQDKEGIPSDRQPLFFKGKQLKDRRCVTDYNIEMFSCLQMPVSLNVNVCTMEVSIVGSVCVDLKVKADDTIHSIKAKIQVIGPVLRRNAFNPPAALRAWMILNTRASGCCCTRLLYWGVGWVHLVEGHCSVLLRYPRSVVDGVAVLCLSPILSCADGMRTCKPS